MKNSSDNALCLLLNEGCEKAYTEIYNRYWTSMYLVARNRVLDQVIAEEIVQSIFLNLWKRRTAIHIEDSFKPYFAKAVKFEIINYHASGKYRENYLNWLSNNRERFSLSIEEDLDAKLLSKLIEETVCVLPERCQLIFRLRVESGYSQKEIAAELSISEKTVEVQLSKARKRIRAVLGVGGVVKALLIFLNG
ncbi:MAG: RNA polymerase sigma factor [Sphingobacterium sp.]